MAYLRQDEHGSWLGHQVTPDVSPGRPGVALIPRHGCHVAHFKKPPSLNWVYVDIPLSRSSVATAPAGQSLPST
jgi:hypothetical protein